MLASGAALAQGMGMGMGIDDITTRAHFNRPPLACNHILSALGSKLLIETGSAFCTGSPGPASLLADTGSRLMLDASNAILVQ